MCTTDDRQGAAGAQFARKLGLKKAFIVDDNETYGKGLADVFEAQFKAAGGTVLGHEHLTKGQADFKALLTKAHALGPDLVFYGGTTVTGGALLRKQMGDTGLGAVTFLGGDGISDTEFLKSAGAGANGSYYTVAAPETSKLPSATAFVKAYEKRWNTDVGPYSANAYTAAEIEIAAIEKALAANGGKMPTAQPRWLRWPPRRASRRRSRRRFRCRWRYDGSDPLGLQNHEREGEFHRADRAQSLTGQNVCTF